MQNDQIKDLALALASAKSEDEISRIIRINPVLKTPENWKAYGTANNIGTVTGQSPEAVPSLVEKIVNSIDAILIKECVEYGDDPKSDNSPSSMEEALQKYFKLNDEAYSLMSMASKRGLAEEIQVIADGAKESPNISIYDSGEGQEPQKFPDTFLSIGGENKRSIFFVQGKYNMGGTAVLPFCGKNWYQLIISKRSEGNKFGFTLVRRNRRENERVKSSTVDYCTNSDGKIFEFSTHALDLGLYNRKFENGTFIKLFNYDLRSRSDITLDLWRNLNSYLYKSALPILLYETRPYAGKTPTKIMHGNRTRILLDERESVEKSISMNITSNGIKYPVEVYLFKKEVKPREFIGNAPVTFTVNGQVQHKLDNNFLTAKAKKAYLKGSLLVNVDCTAMPRGLHEDIFHSSRSFMRDIKEYRDLLEILAKELKDNDVLREIDDQRQKDKVYQNPKDEEFLKNIMTKLLRDDSEIEKLLGLRGIIRGDKKVEQNKIRDKKGERFIGKRFPSFFRFKYIANGGTKMLPQNGDCKIEIETDAEDEFVIRPNDKGELKIRIQSPVGGGEGHTGPGEEDEELLDVNVVGPNEGQIKLHIKPNRVIEVGTVIPLEAKLSSPSGQFELLAYIRIDRPSEKKKQDKDKVKQTYSLPQVVTVYKHSAEGSDSPVKTWEDLNWDERDICSIQESSQDDKLVDAIYVNMDSRELHNYIKSKRITGENVQRVMRTYKTSVYLISLVAYNHYKHLADKQESQSLYSSNSQLRITEPGEMVSMLMRSVSKILIHITTNESLIKELEEVEV